MTVLFFVPLLSGLWSSNQAEWLAIMRVKLPLLLLPIAFAAPFTLSHRQWEVIGYVFAGLITAGTIWSMFQYLPQSEAVQQGYLQARSIVTPLDNDHVRFSWLVSVAALLAGWGCYQKIRTEKRAAAVLLLVMTWLIVFLHILAARTGLLSFYCMLFLAAIWSVYRNIGGRNGWWLLLACLVLPVLAYVALPTFQNKIKYLRYDFSFFRQAAYQPATNDAVRIISMREGWTVFTSHPLTGVGFGDIMEAVNDQYTISYPQMLATDRIYPSSEYLLYAAGAGIMGLLLFIAVMVIPFFTTVRHRLPWYLLNVAAALSLLFDVGLEVQYGVFIYAFVVLWWWKWQQVPLSPEK